MKKIIKKTSSKIEIDEVNPAKTKKKVCIKSYN